RRARSCWPSGARFGGEGARSACPRGKTFGSRRRAALAGGDQCRGGGGSVTVLGARGAVGAPLADDPLELGQRLRDHLVHVVVLVGRQAADEVDVSRGIGQRFVGLVLLRGRRVQNRVVGVTF